MVNIYKPADISLALLQPSGSYMNASGTALWIGLVQENSVKENEGRTDIRYMSANTRNPSLFINNKPEYTGTLRYLPQDGQMFTFVLGSVADSGSPNYLHTISEVDNASKNLYWFELHESKNAPTTPFSRKICGIVADSIRLRAKMGEPVEAEVRYTAGSIAYLAALGSTATANTAQPYMWSNGLINVTGAALNALTLGGNLTEVKEFEWTLDNNFDHPNYIQNTRFKGESIPGNRDVMLKLTMNMAEGTGASLYSGIYKTGSAFNATVFLFRTSGADANATADTLRIVMSGCIIKTMDMPSPHDGPRLEQNIEIVPSGPTTIIVRDTIASYATKL